ncbi:prefoldin subunit 1 [Meleagris gallopavo]|uniref:prefoldin subunit 1 n=1 Tax=Meleagris gallopavo TaxID=9103 RepID=UPI000549B191|nr:prefoldin subunit 1 [Meleagris gallopavo]
MAALVAQVSMSQRQQQQSAVQHAVRQALSPESSLRLSSTTYTAGTEEPVRLCPTGLSGRRSRLRPLPAPSSLSPRGLGWLGLAPPAPSAPGPAAAPRCAALPPQAFTELQAKVIDTQQKVKLADIQIEQLSKTKKHAHLTDTEIMTLVDETRMYEGVGRM